MSSDRREDGRYAVGLLVRLQHPDVDTFVERFATNVSAGGMFIRTRQPKPAGTRVRFEVVIAEGRRVMRGEAVVRWVRGEGDAGGPAGMGLKFLKIDPETKALLDRMLGQPEREAPAAPPSPEPDEAVVPAPAEPPARPEPTAPAGPAAGAEADAMDLIGVPPSEVESAPPEPAGRPVDVPLDDLLGNTPPTPPPSGPAPAEESDELDVDVALPEADAAPPRQGPVLVWLDPPEEVPATGPVIGIDLGTTNSAVAVMQDGRPRILPSREGYNTVPSVVALSGRDRLLVGHPARSQMLTNPRATVYGAKRLVGRSYDSPTVEAVRDRFHYDVLPDAAGRASVRLGGSVVTLEEIQGLVLRECREMAQQALGEPVHRAVVTVPAYYSDAQRHAVREAARLSGLRVERVLNEPTAAALAYGLGRGLDRRILIYDLGGGTFDATAMAIEGNVFEVLATGGDTFLGGVDFDNQVVDWLLERFEATTGVPFAGDPVALSRVADAAERAKMALSERSVEDIHVPFLMTDDAGRPLDLKCRMTRDDLERLTQSLVERTLDVVRDVLLDARLKPGDVEDVILVGGQSRMPLVRRALAAFFGREPHAGVHPDEAVALGAGLLAGTVERVSDVVLIDVLPMTVGVGLPGGRFKRVIERNSPLPVRKTYRIATSRDDQRAIEVTVFQGEDEEIAGNEYLGTVRLDDLPKGPRGSVQVAVTFDLTPECVLEVSARELTGGREVRAELATRDTPEEVRRRLSVDQGAARAAADRRRKELSGRGGGFWRFLKRMVGGQG